MRKVVAMMAAGLLIATGMVVWTAGSAGANDTATAVLRNQAGLEVGVVRFMDDGGVLQVRANATFPSSLEAGFKGFHIHAGSACTDNFVTSAGAHLGHNASDPPSTPHGGHPGDMPVLLVNDDGSAWSRFQTDRVTVSDVLGHTVIVHAGADNYANIPSRYGTPDNTTLGTGDAGSRYACGVIR